MRALLFFDDWLLHAREGLDRKQGHPQPVKGIDLGHHPEAQYIAAVRGITWDERCGRFVTYADCLVDNWNRYWIRLETDDPYEWPVPQWTSSSGPLWTRTANVAMDQHDNPLMCFNVASLAGTPLADRGYAATLLNERDRYGTTGDVIAFSADGVHFEVQEGACWIPHHSDTGDPILFNPWTEQFMLFCRPGYIDRRVAQVVSADLKTFSPATVVLQPDPEDPVCRQFYGLDPVLYEDLFVGTLSIYDTEPTQKGRNWNQGTADTHLAYSHNGHNWYRAFRDAFIPVTEPGTPAGGSVYTLAPLRAPDNRLLFIVHGCPTGHGPAGEDCPRDPTGFHPTTHLYDLRLDGFAYLKTRAQYGLVRTKTVIPQGGEITANIRTTPYGYLKAALLDEETFEPLPNYTLEDSIPVTGDELFGKVRWRTRENLDELKDRPVILEVRVRDAELYALRFSYWVAFGPDARERI